MLSGDRLDEAWHMLMMRERGLGLVTSSVGQDGVGVHLMLDVRDMLGLFERLGLWRCGGEGNIQCSGCNKSRSAVLFCSCHHLGLYGFGP